VSLNKKLMELYKEETNQKATYIMDGATYHALRYVDWLEAKIISQKTKNFKGTERLINGPIHKGDELLNE